MSWNYRVILHDLDPDPEKHWHGLHEVWYGQPGAPAKPGLGWSKEPDSFSCDLEEGPETIIKMLEDALATLRDPRYAEVIKESEWERHKRPGRTLSEE